MKYNKNNKIFQLIHNNEKKRVEKEEILYLSTKRTTYYLVLAYIFFVDFLISSLSMAIAYYGYFDTPVFSNFGLFHVNVGPFFKFSIQYPTAIQKEFLPYLSVLYFVPFIRVGLLNHFGLYKIRGAYSSIDETSKIFKAICIGSLVIIATAFMYRGGIEYRAHIYARRVFVLDFAICFFALALWRVMFRIFQSRMRVLGFNLIPILIVGMGENSRYIINVIRKSRKYGYNIVGLIRDDENILDGVIDGVKVLGTMENIPSILKSERIEEVLLTNRKVSHKKLFELMMKCPRNTGVKFKVVPDLLNFVPGKLNLIQVGNIPLIELFEDPLRGYNRFVKRTLDLLLIFITLPVLLPIFIIIAVAIKLESKGPIIFSQERIGRDGRVFLFYKFRSMLHNCDSEIHKEYLTKLIKDDRNLNMGNNEKPVFKLKNDNRITKVGKFIRKYSLDEFPQLINVIKGEMSLVGPRPPITYEVECYKDWHRKRLEVTPGCTGLWQVSGRNALNFDQMVELDIFYIEHWSILLDLRIILHTIPAIIKGKGAY